MGPSGAQGRVSCPPPMLDQSSQIGQTAMSQETELVAVGWGEEKKRKGDQPKKEPIRLRSSAHTALLNANHALGNPIHLSPPLLPSIRPPAHTAPFLLWNVFSET